MSCPTVQSLSLSLTILSSLSLSLTILSSLSLYAVTSVVPTVLQATPDSTSLAVSPITSPPLSPRSAAAAADGAAAPAEPEEVRATPSSPYTRISILTNLSLRYF
jgi:hypothetical protein